MNSLYITYLENNVSKNTENAYIKAVNSFLDSVSKEDKDIVFTDVDNWVGQLKGHYSSATIAQYINAVKHYFRFLCKMGIIDNDPTVYVEKPAVYNKEKHYISQEMAQAMINHTHCIRDKAITMLFVTAGVRVNELLSLTVSQYESMREQGMNSIEIVAKGNKKHFIYFNEDTIEVIDMWLKARKNMNAKCDTLFITNQGNAIARNNLSLMFKRVAKEAGIPFWQDICNHAMRSACASILNDNGVDIETIRDILGHSSVTTTSRYIKTSEKARINAVNTLKFA